MPLNFLTERKIASPKIFGVRHPRIGLFGIADKTCVVDLLAGEADVFGGCQGFNVPVWNLEIPAASVPLNLPPLLRRVVGNRRHVAGFR